MSKLRYKEETAWHNLSFSEVMSALGVDLSGLSESEVETRIRQYGGNVLERGRRAGFLTKLASQFKSPLVLILVGALALTLFLREFFDAIVIAAALFVNVLIGLIQEGKASQAFEKLSKSQENFAEVVRGGERKRLNAKDLALGDIIIVEQGAKIPADIRFIKTNSLEVEEAILTGESSAVKKDADSKLADDTPLAERENMGFMGTVVAGGFGKGVIVSVGKNTELGKIAESLESGETAETPIQKNMARLARFLLGIVLLVIVLIFALGIFRGEPLTELILLAIAVAVSVVPEGLPAAVTAVLAVGMEHILKKGGLVRNLLAAETLGATTVILTDKTGTLTKAEMNLEEVFTLNKSYKLEKETNSDEVFQRVMYLGALASDAFIEKSDDKEIIRGRPLERALLEAALRVGIDQRKVLAEDRRIDYLPFESKRRFEASLHEKIDGSRTLVYSGSPEEIIRMAGKVLEGEEEVEFATEREEHFNKILEKKTRDGMRFIAAAYSKSTKEIDKKNPVPATNDPNIIFAGIFAFSDPIREDVREAVTKAQQAGARVIMLTGDHPGTARYVAEQVSISGGDKDAVTGVEVGKMSDEELKRTLKENVVYARMAPEDKLRVAKILLDEGEVIAMTGDGVNDAPALKFASIGVAVESGTEVAKEASDLILLKNSFRIIVDAIEEGRRIIDNLKKVVAHLLSTSFGEVFVIAGAMLFGLPLPILPVQILWVNIIEEGLLNFAFAFEPAEDGVMKRSPQEDSVKTVLSKNVKKLILISGSVTGVLVLILYLILNNMSLSIEEVRTIIFAALSVDAIFFAVSIKNLHRPIWKIDMRNNIYLLVSLVVSTALLLLTLSLGPMQTLLSLVPLSSFGIGVLAAVAILDMVVIETTKFFVFKRAR